ncbi:aldose epimerase family protein [Sphingosinicella sp. LHD-64]|uniref:aldose epimerase family protein n=1 Tax=Sphingosinicella sp. LHD-64 TaxID=3072139 RepID=UPI0028103D3B|nr:aldose epimerase family protein [Sphingosinicella sp. LHD-64]MDQ8758107.1 aldose epimerase family protein [Sphingosinicella sp. LHD-64]
MTDYRLDNGNGLTLRFLDRGGIITAIEAPDREDRRANVVLGLASPSDYESLARHYYLGSLIGRYAGRIAGARFAIDGHEFRLDANDGANTLHGGRAGFDIATWAVEPIGPDCATLHLASPDGAGGFPGRLDVAVTYRLLADNALRIDYRAVTDAPTMLNLTHHGYFNLGAGARDIREHRLEIAGDRVAEVDASALPTGALLPVAETAFDFRSPRAIGARFDEGPWLGGLPGYDHSWVLADLPRADPRFAARMADPLSGRTLEVWTTEPTLHVYTANHFPGAAHDAAGVPLGPHRGVALETQHLPNSPNLPGFPTTLLRPGERFRSTTIFRFGTGD